MPILEPDMSEVEVGTIPAGTYPARITGATTEKSKGGNMMIVLDLAVQHDGKERNRKAWVVTTGKGAFQFPRLLRAVKMVDIAKRYEGGEKFPFDTDTLLGQLCQVTIEAELYNGEERDKITGFLPLA